MKTPFDTTDLDKKIELYNELGMPRALLRTKYYKKERQRLFSLVIKKAQEFNGSIKTEEDLWEHMKRLQECSICKRDYYDKRCPDCFLDKAEVERIIDDWNNHYGISLDVMPKEWIKELKKRLGMTK